MRRARVLRRFAALPLLALAFASAAIAPGNAVDAPDLTQPFAIATDGTAPLVVAASPDGRHLYAANQNSTAITIISTATSAQVGSIPLAGSGNGVTVAPDGTVWATQRAAGKVAKIVAPLSASPTITYHWVDEAQTGRPVSVALSPSGDALYASVVTLAGGTSSKVTMLSTATGAIIDESTPFQNASSAVSVAPDGSVWVAGDTPQVFPGDLSSSQPTPGVASGRAGQATFSGDGSTAYVAVRDAIKIVDTNTMSVLDTISSPSAAHDPATKLFGDLSWLARSPDSTTLYAVNYDRPAMAVIDLAGAAAGTPGSITQIDGPTADPEDAGDWQKAAYLNSVVAVGNAFYVAVDGTNYDGTTVMRYPVAPRVDAPSTAATPGGTVSLTGSALEAAAVTIGDVAATTLSSSYAGVTVKVPALPSLSTGTDVPVSVTTPSGTTSTQIDVTLTTAIPKITGSARVGNALTVVPGAWTPGTRIGYQWLASGTPISGATKASVTLTGAQAGKAITVRATGAYGSWGRTVRTSAATARVSLGTLRSAVPKVSGTAKVGRKLTAKPGSWTTGTKLTYRWYAGTKAIKGATKPKLKLSPKLKGKKIKVKVTGTKAGYVKAVTTSKRTKKVR